MIRLLACLALFVPVGAGAQTVTGCDGRASPENIPEPWDETTRSFANGKVRVALVDTGSPAAGPFYLLVLLPSAIAGEGDRDCVLVGWTRSAGFVSLDFAGMEPSYDPATGLSLGLAARFYDAALDFSNVGILDVVINQTSGEVRAGFTVTGRD